MAGVRQVARRRAGVLGAVVAWCIVAAGGATAADDGAAVAAGVTADTSATIANLAWLAGCWERVDREPGSGETWTAPAGGTMLGVSRTVRQGRTVEYEFVVIRRNVAGVLEYVAHPAGQAPAAFALVRHGPREVVFENPAHDFPQRILYRLEEGGRLQARIEGPTKNGPRAVDFPLRRVECPGGPGDRHGP